MSWLLASGVVAVIVVPLLVSFESSGTVSYREAAGTNAEFIEVDGIDVYVQYTPLREDTGAAEPSSVIETAETPLFVLLHGFGASTFSWREVVDPLSSVGDVLAYDRPGFGFTERPTRWTGESPYGFRTNLDILNALLDRFGKDHDVILVGHSAGGQLAAAYVEDFPTRVQRLVLVDPAMDTSGGVPAGLRWLLEVPQVDRMGPFLVQGIASSGLDLLYRSYYNPTLVTEEIVAGYQAPLRIVGWEQALWEYTKAPKPERVLDRLHEIDQPTLLISGEDDSVVPVADTEKLATIIPNSTLMIITQSAHLPHEEQPQVFVHTVTQWLKS